MFRLKFYATTFAVIIGLLTTFTQTARAQQSCTFIGQQATLTRQDGSGVTGTGSTTVQSGSVEFNGIPNDVRFSVDVEGTSVKLFNNTSNTNAQFNSPNTITISVAGSQTITGINSVTINGVTNFTPQNVSFTSNSVTFNVAGSVFNAGTSVVVGLQLSCLTTAATVTVSGRVTTAQGRGIRNVVITMFDSSGNTRTAISTTFGYYRFEEVAAGETYIFTARGKRFSFEQTTQVHMILEDTNNIDFLAYNQSELGRTN